MYHSIVAAKARALALAAGLLLAAASGSAASDSPLENLDASDETSERPATSEEVSSATVAASEGTTALRETTVPTSSSTTLPVATTTTATTTTTTTTTATTVPVFVGTIEEITPEVRSAITSSWREGCPVGLEDLRYLTITHWDYDEQPVTGELIVHADHAADLVWVFEQLFNARFLIQNMELVDRFESNDDLSMAANNTSAFNCREVAWKPGVWSNHAYGTAIDINPLVNPYVAGNVVLPPEGVAYADRSVEVAGGIYRGDAVTKAFADIGWGWGGDWSSAKDWQHFSASGN